MGLTLINRLCDLCKHRHRDTHPPTCDAFPERIHAPDQSAPYVGGRFSLDTIERQHIQRVIDQARTLDEAAEVLGVDASTLWRKRRRFEKE